jgi:uncharacterized protein YktA (UPF0223 family)
MNVDEIIKALSELNLSNTTDEKIRDLIKLFGEVAFIEVTLHKGKTIMRARPNNGAERFNLKSQLSFKPQEYNKTYQRASTPEQTMFYGCVLPEKMEAGELYNERVIGIFESTRWLRDNTTSGYQRITFGKWIVEEDIKLAAIMHNKSYYDASVYTKELVDAYKEFVNSYPSEFVEKCIKIQDFLASEFSKEINLHTDYMISAVFTEAVTKMKGKDLDGIIYPSVRVDGKGFNVALKPESCSKLGLYVAGECSIYKVKNEIIVGNDYLVELDGKQDEFVLIEIENNREQILAMLGLNSLDELKNMA